jgi:hypothetical protein
MEAPPLNHNFLVLVVLIVGIVGWLMAVTLSLYQERHVVNICPR